MEIKWMLSEILSIAVVKSQQDCAIKTTPNGKVSQFLCNMWFCLSFYLGCCLARFQSGHTLPVFPVISSGLTDTLPAAFISSRLAV